MVMGQMEIMGGFVVSCRTDCASRSAELPPAGTDRESPCSA